MPRYFNNCKLCDWINATSANPVGKGIARVAGLEICERHGRALVAIAAENGINAAEHFTPMAGERGERVA